ncbi:MAG: hypothetical protein ACI4GB_04190 [Acutalibacteraceae bacterium]
MRYPFGEHLSDIDVEKTRQFYEKAETIAQECSGDGCCNYEKSTEGSIINGKKIPCELSYDELKEMCRSSYGNDFAIACKAISSVKTMETYQFLKSFMFDKDKYRRLNVLDVIFTYPYSTELRPLLIEYLQSMDILFVRRAAQIISEMAISVSDLVLTTTLKQYPNDEVIYLIINQLSKTKETFYFLSDLFKKSKKCLCQEMISDFLVVAFADTNSKEIFDLLRKSPFGKIRCVALRIGFENHYDLSGFESDADGHVKKCLLSLRQAEK